MRDTVSYLAPDRQNYVFSILDEMMKPGGLLILGTHEETMNPDAWDRVENAGVAAYRRNTT